MYVSRLPFTIALGSVIVACASSLDPVAAEGRPAPWVELVQAHAAR